MKKVKRFLPFGFLVLLSAFLNIFRLSRLGYDNSYYAAAIKSMITNFANFFFVSADSTGFISVDKAPLSLWVDTIFAKVFGFSGFAILLPHALEGIIVTILVYIILQKISLQPPP
jgi:4-amino-4-deoxy-L-arabinose transferase-like glycosyltransferase